jgi:hypothetical protein
LLYDLRKRWPLLFVIVVHSRNYIVHLVFSDRLLMCHRRIRKRLFIFSNLCSQCIAHGRDTHDEIFARVRCNYPNI